MLTNKTIFIGRESGRGRLLVSTRLNGQLKTFAIDTVVPKCVSHSEPAQDKAHCRIDIDQSGQMLLTNLNPLNVTYVNGREIESKKITETSDVSLGINRYALNIETIIAQIERMVPAQPKVYSILPLKKVYDDRERSMDNLKKRRKFSAGVQRLYIPLMLFSTIAGVALTKIGLDETLSKSMSTVFYVLAVIILMYGLYLIFTDKSDDESKRIERKFQDNCVCPNPECRRYLGNLGQSYNLLRQHPSCPYCKCKFVEK